MKRTALFFFIFIWGIKSAFPAEQGRAYSSAPQWKLMKTVRFNIYFPDECETAAVKAGRAAERAYIKAAEAFGHELTETLPVFVYPENISPFRPYVKPAFYTFLKYAVFVPLSYDEKIPDDDIYMQMAFAFERDILLSDNWGSLLSRNACGMLPEWFLTGLASYTGRTVSGKRPGDLLREARDKGRTDIKSSGELKALFESARPEEDFQPVSEKTSGGKAENYEYDNGTDKHTEKLKEREMPKTETFFDFRETVFSAYSPASHLNGSAVIGFESFRKGLACAAGLKLFDTLNIHNISIHGGFVKDEEAASPWGEAVYSFHKYRLSPFISAFGKGSVPMLKPPEFFGRERLDLEKSFLGREGNLSAGLSYAFFKYFSAEGKTEVFKYAYGNVSSFLLGGDLTLKGGTDQNSGRKERKAGISGSISFSSAHSVSGDDIHVYRLYGGFSSFVLVGIHKLTLSGITGISLGNEDKDAGDFYAGGTPLLRARALGSMRGKAVAGASFEYGLLLPKLRLPFRAGASETELLAFADICAIEDKSFAADAGIGLRLIFFPSVFLRLDLGFPIYRFLYKKCTLNFSLGIFL